MTVTKMPSRNPDGTLICPDGHVTSIELLQRTGITYRQLDYWTRTGLLHPADRRPGATSGDPRFFPTDQVHRAAALRWLLDAGISLPTCRRVIDELITTGQARLTDGLTIHLSQP